MFDQRAYEEFRSLVIDEVTTGRLRELTLESIFVYKPNSKFPLSFILEDIRKDLRHFSVDDSGVIHLGPTMSRIKTLRYLANITEKKTWTLDSFQFYAEKECPHLKPLGASLITNFLNQELELLARGTYGPPELLELDTETKWKAFELIHSLLENGPKERQWHCNELYLAAVKKRIGKPFFHMNSIPLDG